MSQTSLVEYGIQNERSDLRAHVCVLALKVYVFPTWAGRKAAESGRFRAVNGWQPGVDRPTSLGFLVPPSEIECCLPVAAGRSIAAAQFLPSDNTSAKGEKAVDVVEVLLRKGWFPLPANPNAALSSTLQREGVDVIVSGKWRIQVKCDYKGGVGDDGCTGFLFLQTHEINPYKAR
jgi:hypothetical protein